MANSHPILAEQFDDLEQQREASVQGMWIFLATEVMLFGGMIMGYIVYRSLYPAAFSDASRHLHVVLGSINTAVLLCSSLTMALSVHAAQTENKRALIGFLLLTILLGSAFLGIKAFEYYKEYKEHVMPLPGLPFIYPGHYPQKAELFFNFYFAMTGLHALHLTIAIGVVSVITFLAWRDRFASADGPVEITGLYWHFVDIVWVFLFPILYLPGRS